MLQPTISISSCLISLQQDVMHKTLSAVKVKPVWKHMELKKYTSNKQNYRPIYKIAYVK